LTHSSIESSWSEPDRSYELPLRPQSLADFEGQEALSSRLSVILQAAKGRGEPLGHSLFYGPPGLGKTTLAGILAKEMGTNLVVTSGPVIEKAGDLAGLLTHLKAGDILFIDEIHRLTRQIEEYLYPAMEDFSLDLMIDSGPAARSVQLKLEPFTLVGATTQVGQLSAPLRSRFLFTGRLEYYSEPVLTTILLRSSSILGVQLTAEGAKEIARRARGTPRIANNLLRWVRDVAWVQKSPLIDDKIAREALKMLSLDERGLDEMDKKVLTVLMDQFNGGPAGIQSLAVAVGEDPTTLAEVYEPFLILQGLLRRTPRGREVTPLAYAHLGRSQTNE